VLSGLLVGFAALAALVLRDPVVAEGAGSPLRRCAEMVRLASATSVTLLYVLALGGMASIAVFLPVFLQTAFGFRWQHALVVTVTVIALSGLARMAGGWWTDRRPTAHLLTVCYGIAAGLCLVAATTPPGWVAAPALTGIALCDGLASGALLALIGKAARPGCAGVVMGMTGAAGAVGALIPPLLFAVLHHLMHSYVVAWTLLAATLVAAARYVRRHDLYIGLGLAVRSAPEPSPTAMTVAMLGESDARLGAAAVVARLAELAASDELVIVYGADERPGLSAHALAAGLRHRLPRHSVVAVRVGRRADALGRDALLLGDYVEAGTLAIAVTPSAELRNVAADLSLYLQADRMLRVSYTTAAGAGLHPER
jgi:NNP family nitrate/nitrite transporter-like MFS transporter